VFHNPKTDSTWQDPASHRCGYVRFNDFRVHFLDWGGNGPAIVFLPELGASAHVFDDFALPFTQRLRVVAVTPPAGGQSETPDSPLSIDYVANAVLAVLDSLEIERAHFIGDSFAGTVITRIAVRHPRRVRSLVYLDGFDTLFRRDRQRQDGSGV
jgi:pimeloyl-ACP methyl ester carboxylesterase